MFLKIDPIKVQNINMKIEMKCNPITAYLEAYSHGKIILLLVTILRLVYQA
jgi:hypothetical protein